MKRLVLSISIVLFCILVNAQVPEFFNYQAIVRNTAGQPLVTQEVVFLFSIIKTTTGGTVVYTEKHAVETNQFGLVTLAIGNGTDKTGNFTTIDWGADTYFLNVQIDKGDAILNDMGTTQLLSVPYALRAKSTDQWLTYGTNIYRPTGNVGIGVSIPTAKLDVNGEVNVNNNKITNVAAPVSDNDAANKAYVDNLLEEISHLKQILGIGSITDIDGNSYGTIKIGGLVWMTENLKTTKYRDGTDIPYVDNALDWKGLITPGYCYYKNDEASYKATYGALYNWYAASTSTLCPTGWHVPTNAEWTNLTDFLGGESVAGGKLKEAGTTHWNSPNTGATNEVYFAALPGEYRDWAGAFWGNIGNNGLWWSVTSGSIAGYAWYRCIYYNQNLIVSTDSGDKRFGYSVRCVKD